MTTGQVDVAGGTEGPVEPYNVMIVDRGDGDGKEQIVQQIALTASGSGSLVNDGDTVVVDTTGMAGVTAFLSGAYVSATLPFVSVYWEVTFDGTIWQATRAALSFPSQSTYDLFFQPSDDTAYVIKVLVQGAVAARLRLADNNLASGAIDVTMLAQPGDPFLQDVFIAGASGDVNVVFNGQTQDVQVVLNAAAITYEGGTQATATISGNAETTPITINDLVMVQLSGSLNATIDLQVSLDDISWFTLSPSLLIDATTGAPAGLSGNGLWIVNFSGVAAVKVVVSGYVSGSSDVVVQGKIGLTS